MQESIASITQLGPGIEALTSQLKDLPSLDQGSGSQYLQEVVLQGLTLDRWVERLWPNAFGLNGHVLSIQAINSLITQQNQAIYQAEQSLYTRQNNLKQNLFSRQKNTASTLKDFTESQEELAQAKTRLKQLLKQKKQNTDELIKLQKLGNLFHEKLTGISPKGLSKFVDQNGKPVTKEQIKELTKRLELVNQKNLSALKDKERLTDSINSVQQRYQKASEKTALKKETYQKNRNDEANYKKLFSQKNQNLKQEAKSLENQRLTLNRLKNIKHNYENILNKTSNELAVFLLEPQDSVVFSKEKEIADSLNQASNQTNRLNRLANLMESLEKRLEKKANPVTDFLKQQRKINKQIKAFETRLPKILKPFINPDQDNRLSREAASADLSILLAEMSELQPKAYLTQNKLKDLKTQLERNLARGRLWQKAWRESGKQERHFLSQGMALAQETQFEAEKIGLKAQDLTTRLIPLVESFNKLISLDLLPSFAACVFNIINLKKAENLLSDQYQKTQGKIPLKTARNLSKPPIALKPFSAQARRLSGKDIEIAKLNAIKKAAEQWLETVNGQVITGLLRPVEDRASNLANDLAKISGEHELLAKNHSQTEEKANNLAFKLDKRNKENKSISQALKKSKALNQKQGQKLNQYHKSLSSLKNQYQNTFQDLTQQKKCSNDLAYRLNQAENTAQRLAQKLEHSQKMAKALKAKSIDTHHQHKKALKGLEELDYWQKYSKQKDLELSETKAQLQAARLEYDQARQNLATALAEREETHQELARERAARARQALDLLGGKALSIELAASQGEAGRWIALARDMALALVINGKTHEEQTTRLREQLARLSSEAALMKRQLERVSSLMDRVDFDENAQQTPKVGIRITPMDPDQLMMATSRLSSARHRLQKLGRSTLGHWAMIAALTSSLVLMPPSSPSKATRADSPIREPRPITRSILQKIDQGPMFKVPVASDILNGPMGKGKLAINLLPIKDEATPLPTAVKVRLGEMAQQSGLSPKVLLTSARAIYAGQEVVDANVLHQITDIARNLAERHPLIFRELAHKGLPANTSDLTTLRPALEKGQHLFMDRLYSEYRSLGFSPEEALGALAANERAMANLVKKQPLPKYILGKVTPLSSVENLKIEPFLKRMVPYIESRLKVFMRQRSMVFAGDINEYANNLAFDMYCASKKFEVPLTFLLSIAHQETWYANVLGDQNRSASPFQIFEPTRKLIRLSMKKAGFVAPPAGIKLERHLTMATYMAAFHLRELMTNAVRNSSIKKTRLVDADKVMLRYNGSKAYITQVALRQKQLAKFMRRKNKGKI